MTGIGFLGAGVIVHQKGTVRGLTTAAGIWCIAAVGLAIGFGMYSLGILASGLILVCLWLLDYVEDWLPKVRYRTVTLQTAWRPGVIVECVDRFKAAGLEVMDANFTREDDLKLVKINLQIRFISKSQYYELERKLEADEHFQLLATREL
jgi:putative Mg2+ transporter-C (MgtC) family protein